MKSRVSFSKKIKSPYNLKTGEGKKKKKSNFLQLPSIVFEMRLC